MKITDIQTYVVKMPNEVPYLGTSASAFVVTDTGYFQRPGYPTFYSHATESFLVKIVTDEGLVGWGEAQAPLVPEVLETIVQRLFKPFYLGRDPLQIDALWKLAYEGLHERGHFTSFPVDAMAACNIALWDIAGKAAGRSVSQMLGGAHRSQVPCYVSGLPRPTVEERAELAAEWCGKGFHDFKVALGFGVDLDLESLHAVRDAAGPDAGLMNDAHWRYGLSDAVRLGRGMEDLGCTFLEAPTAPEDLDGLARLAETLDIDVAMGEERRTRFQFRDVFDRRSADIVQPDVGRTGLSEFRKIATMAEAHHVPVVPHLGPAFGVYLAASIHAAAATPNCPIMEWQPSVFDRANRILAAPIVCEAGKLTVAQGPGLGVEVDEEALLEFTVDSATQAKGG